MGNLLAGLNPTKDGKKGLFDQPGGTFGMVVLAGIIVGGGILLYKALPYLITLVDNAATLALKLMYLGGIAVVAGVILTILFDKKLRRNIGLLYMMAMKKMTGWIINIDPIVIIENAILKMEKSIQKMEFNMSKLNGERLKLKRKIQDKKNEMEECLRRASAAQNMNKKDLAVIEERQAVRLQKHITMAIDLHNSTDKWYNNLSKLAEMAKLTVIDTKNEVDARKDEYQMVKSAHKAFKSAMSALDGDPDELALYNQTLEAMQTDVMSKLGEMDRIISQSGGFIDKLDVEKEMYAIHGNELLKQYDEKGIEALFSKFETLPSGKQIQHNTSNAYQFASPIQNAEPIPAKKYLE